MQVCEPEEEDLEELEEFPQKKNYSSFELSELLSLYKNEISLLNSSGDNYKVNQPKKTELELQMLQFEISREIKSIRIDIYIYIYKR